MNNAGVYAYTPRGDVMQLPAEATPVDFAYAVHTEVGHACIGARVNGRLVSLESELQTGDVVEIFTSKSPDAGPSRDWLEFVKSPRARNKIRQWFTKERREEAIERGRDSIAKQMRKENLPLHRLFNHDTLDAVAKDLHLADVSALYAAVGEGNVGAQNVVERVINLAGGREGAEEDLAEATSMPGRRAPQPGRTPVTPVWSSRASTASCWSSWPDVARRCPATRSRGSSRAASGVSVHRVDCVNLEELREPARAARGGALGADGARARSWSPSRSRRSTVRAC